MIKFKLPHGKPSLLNILSLGVMLLGIGFISWAMYGIWDQSNYSALPLYAAENTKSESNQLILPESSSPSFSANIEESIASGGDFREIPPRNEASILPVHSDKNPVAAETAATTSATTARVLLSANPVQGETMGILTIPALDQVFPIIEGTGTEELKRGVGHYVDSALPGENSNCVLSGHRDSVFSKLGRLVIGDLLIVQTSSGTYKYEIVNIRIVDKDDRTIIVPSDHGVLTVTTCYPFVYVGSAPDRYIVTADLVFEN